MHQTFQVQKELLILIQAEDKSLLQEVIKEVNQVEWTSTSDLKIQKEIFQLAIAGTIE
jgi:hypothetical protein